jgi:membrane protein DedA with SNARE-associated domain
VLLLTTNQLDPWSYYLAAGARLLAADPLFYLLGRWYGDAMVSWLERRSQTFGEQVRIYERAFSKAAYPLLMLAPNAYVCLFAGASGMPLGTFFALNIAGTLIRLYLLRRLGEAFDKPIGSVLDFFARYRVPLFVLRVALIVFILWNDRRQGKSEIGSMLDLGQESPQGPSSPGEDPEADPNR